MFVLTFREDALLRRDHKDLGDSVEGEQQQWLQGSEGVGEVDQGRYED